MHSIRRTLINLLLVCTDTYLYNRLIGLKGLEIMIYILKHLYILPGTFEDNKTVNGT